MPAHPLPQPKAAARPVPFESFTPAKAAQSTRAPRPPGDSACTRRGWPPPPPPAPAARWPISPHTVQQGLKTPALLRAAGLRRPLRSVPPSLRQPPACCASRSTKALPFSSAQAPSSQQLHASRATTLQARSPCCPPRRRALTGCSAPRCPAAAPAAAPARPAARPDCRQAARPSRPPRHRPPAAAACLSAGRQASKEFSSSDAARYGRGAAMAGKGWHASVHEAKQRHGNVCTRVVSGMQLQ